MSVLLQNRVKMCLGSKLMGDITLVYMVEIVTVCKYRVVTGDCDTDNIKTHYVLLIFSGLVQSGRLFGRFLLKSV